MKRSSEQCAVLAVLLIVAGVLAPLAAVAQTQPTGGYQTAPAAAPASVEPTEGHAVGAGFLNVVYIPGKLIICASGTVASTLVMLLTFGSGYRAAVQVFEEGCHGTWVLTPEHVSGKVPLRRSQD